MELDQADALIAHAIETGCAANAYLLVGDIHGACEELANRVLLRLFPEARDQVVSGAHPDVIRLAPSGKKRIITVLAMRESVLKPLSETSFSGGWKACLIVGADRMEAASANAFLKMLEEPPPKTIFLLLSDQPDAILPTIRSRTQRISLSRAAADVLNGAEREALEEAVLSKDLPRLVELFKALKEEAPDEEVALVRKTFFRTILEIARGKMMRDLADGEAKKNAYVSFRNLTAIEEAYRQSGKSISDDTVLSYLLDHLAL